MADYYPPLGFHFKIEFANYPGEAEFQSVSGLTAELDTEEIVEGGENRFKHKVPVRASYPNLILKRGLLVDSDIINWCLDAIENFDFQPTDLIVKLLNENHDPLVSWNVVHAYPIKWNVSDLNAEENKLAIETLELTYNYFNVIYYQYAD